MKPCTKCGQLHPPKLPCHLANATQDSTLVNNDDEAQKTIQHFGSTESEETEEARQTLQGMGPSPAEKTLFQPSKPLPSQEDNSAPTLFQSGKRETNAKVKQQQQAEQQDGAKTLFEPERSAASQAEIRLKGAYAKPQGVKTPAPKATPPKAAPSKAYPTARQNRIQTPPPQPVFKPQPTSEQKLAPGADVGGYTLEAYLGHGGMGEVWRAVQPKLKRKVAIKILDANLASDRTLVARFEREAQTVNEIHHRNLVDISGFGELPGSGRPYLVMEYLEGRTLTQYLQERGQVPLFEIEPILEQLCDALGEAHRHGVIHRDIKPDNIFLVGQKTERPFIKILDFGLAKVVAENAQLTQTGEVFGTPEYMSPEQCTGAKNIDYRSDLYSLGIVLYEMICGRTPFAEPGDKRGQIWMKHVSQEPSSVTRFMNGRALPPGVDQVIGKSLAKEPAQRYQNAEELFEAFRQITHNNNNAAIKAADFVAHKPKFAPKDEVRRKDSDPPKAAFLAPGQALPGVDRAALQEAKQRRLESVQQAAFPKPEGEAISKPKSSDSRKAPPPEAASTDVISRAKPSAEESDPLLPPAKKPFPVVYLGLGIGGIVAVVFLLIKLLSGPAPKAPPPPAPPAPAPQSAPLPKAPTSAPSTAPASQPKPQSQPETPKGKVKTEKEQPPPTSIPLGEVTLDPFKNKPKTQEINQSEH